jgi:hypothetical protein
MQLSTFGLTPFTSSAIKPGDRFGKLTVLATGRPLHNYRYTAICQCDCGLPPKPIRMDGLSNGAVVSCGCVQKERTTTHGLTNHPLYGRHRHMISRCTDPNSPAYPNYGGRGITVCQRWLDVRNFVQDLEPLYRPGCEIDRINNDGNYEPGNIRFVSSKVNADNRRTAHLLTYKGETKSLNQWAEQYNLRYQLLWDRIVERKWDAEKALNTPPLNDKERMALARAAKRDK